MTEKFLKDLEGFTDLDFEATQDRGLTLYVVDSKNHNKAICEVFTGNSKDAKLFAAAPKLYELVLLQKAVIEKLEAEASKNNFCC